MTDTNKLQAGLSRLGLDLSSDAQKKLIDFLHFLQKWNKTYNLTAITDIDQMIAYHLLDSLSIAPHLTGDAIVDVGAGAGLPGIPLAIYYPEKQFVLIDSVGKKTRFITQAARHLGLSNVEAVHARAEQYPTSHAFDTMTARAVGSMDYLLPIAKHLLKSNGDLLVMRTEVFREDQVENAKVIPLSVPGVTSERSMGQVRLPAH